MTTTMSMIMPTNTGTAAGRKHNGFATKRPRCAGDESIAFPVSDCSGSNSESRIIPTHSSVSDTASPFPTGTMTTSFEGSIISAPPQPSRHGRRHFVTLVSVLAALIFFPALRQQLDYTRSFYRSTREIAFDYPPAVMTIQTTRQQSSLFNSGNSSSSSLYPSQLRPRLDRSTFFHRGPSDDDIQAFFRWDPSTLDDPNNFIISPMWSCRDASSRHTKLIFHHMPKTGGITIRALLKGYALLCNASLAMISQCTFLGRETMDGDTHWANGRNTKHASRSCVLSTALNRSGHVVTTEQRTSTSLLQTHQFDILAGHFPLGSDEFWNDPATGQHVSVQNVVFFRKPLEKFVSQILTDHPGLVGQTVDQTVALIHALVQNRTAHGEYYELYSRTLIRPEQRSWIEQERIPWTSEQRLHLTLRNMVESRMLVGILERLEPSIALLRHLLDRNGEVPDLVFSYFASDKLAQRIALFRVGANHTKNIVARIEQDTVVLADFDEYLKYELAAYDWAVRIHEKQVEGMHEASNVDWITRVAAPSNDETALAHE